MTDTKKPKKIRVRIVHISQYLKHPQTGEALLDMNEYTKALNSLPSTAKFAHIVHDKDVYTEDDIYNYKNHENSSDIADKLHQEKADHVHTVISYANPVYLESVAKKFKVPTQYIDIPKGANAFIECVEYLTHEKDSEQEKGKHRYSDDEVIANFDFRTEVDAYNARKDKKTGTVRNEKDQMLHEIRHEGLTLRRASEKYGVLYSKNESVAKTCRKEYVSQIPLPQSRTNYYICGAGSTGKGVMSEAIAMSLYPGLDEEEVFFHAGSKGVCFDGYDGQPVIIWDDYRAVELITALGGRSEVFQVFDTAPKKISKSVKYSSVGVSNAVNIVNSVEDFSQFLDGLAGEFTDRHGRYHEGEDKTQSYRRFPFIIPINKEYFDILVNKGYAYDSEDKSSYLKYTQVGRVRANLRKLIEHHSDSESKRLMHERVTKDIILANEEIKARMSAKTTMPLDLDSEIESIRINERDFFDYPAKYRVDGESAFRISDACAYRLGFYYILDGVYKLCYIDKKEIMTRLVQAEMDTTDLLDGPVLSAEEVRYDYEKNSKQVLIETAYSDSVAGYIDAELYADYYHKRNIITRYVKNDDLLESR